MNLFNNCDILCVQETWLAKQELEICNSLHDDFLAASVAKVDFSKGILVGRPHGGVSIFYNRRLAKYVTPVYFSNCDWCVGIKVQFDRTCFTLFNVYLPYECPNNEDEYSEKLGILESAIQNIENSAYAIVGDFNCNIKEANGKITSKFAKFVFDLCEENSLISSSKIGLPSDSYTYISDSWGTTSWLDQVISSPDFHNCISDIKVEYDLSSSDHIPFSFNLHTSTLPQISVCENNNSSAQNRFNWKKSSPIQCAMYTDFTDLICTQSRLESLMPDCHDPNCSNVEHHHSLDKVYNGFVNCLLLSANKVTKVKNNSKKNGSTRKPGWSEYVKEKHSQSIEFYKLWRDHGKPRHGLIYEHYRRSKLNYKYAVRAIKRQTDTIIADKTADNLNNKNYSGFWDAVKKFNRKKTVLPQQIGNAVGEKNICDEWKSHFHRIYNSVPGSRDDTYVHIKVGNEPIIDFLFTEAQFLVAVSKLENNKSSGYDNLFAEHIKHCSFSVLRLLCKLFNSFLLHGYLPSSFMSVLISPVFKKGGSICDPDSYRPIALANCLSKIYEALLRDKIIDYLSTSCNQFGYKQKLGTEMCLYTFKEIIDCYNKFDSNIYCCFLDASRAYDRVSHKTLFKMLNDRYVPLIFIRILAYWYKHQSLYIKWGNCLSTPFSVSNGVRQGSVLSPFLFCVYVDKISQRLNETKIGCRLKSLLINHLFYADDLCIFSPSSRGLQTLLDI